MKVIVSDKLDITYTKYMLMRSFKEVLDNASSISTVVIHHADSKEFDLGVYISKLKEAGIRRFVYINENPIGAVKLCILALEGLVLEDEDLFEDEEGLDMIIEEFFEDGANSTALTTQSSVDILSDFIQAFTNGDSKINAPVYIEQVNSALNELALYTQNQELVIKDFATTALDTFNNVSILITKMQDRKQDLEAKLKAMEASIMKNTNAVTPKERMNQALYFQSYQYIGGAKVIQIRELSPCRYLTSFLLGYHYYLSVMLNKRVKLIVCYSKSHCNGKKYDTGFTIINQESKNNKILYTADIIATNTPNNTVMEELMHQKDDVIIVLDRLRNSQPILKKTNVVTLNAISGMSDLRRFDVKPMECIFTTTKHPSNFCCIPHIKGYAPDGDTRRAQYLQACKEYYDKLCKFAKIE